MYLPTLHLGTALTLKKEATTATLKAAVVLRADVDEYGRVQGTLHGRHHVSSLYGVRPNGFQRHAAMTTASGSSVPASTLESEAGWVYCAESAAACTYSTGRNEPF